MEDNKGACGVHRNVVYVCVCDCVSWQWVEIQVVCVTPTFGRVVQQLEHQQPGAPVLLHLWGMQWDSTSFIEWVHCQLWWWWWLLRPTTHLELPALPALCAQVLKQAPQHG